MASLNLSRSDADMLCASLRNPLSDGEIEEKFAELADGVLTRVQQARVRQAIWHLENLSSVTELMSMLESQEDS